MTVATCADNLATALALAAQGLYVFPCHSGGAKAKQPMPFIKWREASTIDAAKIQAWWRKWPDAAIGLDLAKSGFIVIDADRHDPEKDGVEAFGVMMAENGFHPDSAPIVATPSEGNHHYFRQPLGKKYGNADSRMYLGRKLRDMGINVRGYGGYVIAPGTVMADGRYYELYGNLADAPVLPDWLSAILETAPETTAKVQVNRSQHSDARIQSYCDAAIAEETRRVATAGKGSRNNTLNEAAFSLGQLVGAGWVTEAEIAALLENAASECGLPTFEAKKTIRSGITAGMQHPRMLSDDYQNADPVEAAAAARRLIEAHDGTLHDAETGEVVEVEKPTSEPTLAYPPGLVGDIAHWIVVTSRRPQPELAIGAALAIVGTAAGRQFAGPTMSGTHLFILGLAPTGKGKDHALHAIGRIMAAAGLAQHIGPSEFISMPAVVNFLTRRPLSLCAMDEFGGFMKRINSKRASGFESAISKVIRTLWSSSFAPYMTPEWAQKPSETIFAPAMTIYGASTPEQFYSSMEGASLEDGTLNRFLLLSGRDKVKEKDPEQDPHQVPDEIVTALKNIYNYSGPLAVTYRNDPHTDPASHGSVRQVPFCPDGAKERYRDFAAEVETRIDADPDTAPVHARVVEMALRIATIIAVGRCDEYSVRLSDLEMGIAIATASAQLMAQGVADYMADNENQANAQKVMRVVKSRGGRIKYRDLLQSLKNTIKPRDLRELLASMCEAGQLEKQEVKGPTGPATFWYQAV